jgi:FkbM family methyltransferase
VILNYIIEKSVSINRILEKTLGVRLIRRKPTFDDAREFILRKLNPSLIVDGGANQGQWALGVINRFPTFKIVSFEPTKSAFEILRKLSGGHKNWKVINSALGNYDGAIAMNVSSNDGQSSSILNPASHLHHYPQVTFSKIENVKITRLDSMNFDSAGPIYLKLDVQGAEKIALQGAEGLLQKIAAIEIEISLDHAYSEQMDFAECVESLKAYGFSAYSLSDPMRDENGFTMFVDGIFVRDYWIGARDET